jgi:hypothetical protein
MASNVTSGSAVTADNQKGNRSGNWRSEQEQLLFDIVCKPEYRPFGGRSDGKMALKSDEIWKPVHTAFMQALPELNSNLKPRRNKPPRSEFAEADIKRKFDSFTKSYRDAKAALGIVNHPRVGNTGAEAPGEVPEDVLGEAQAKFHLWSAFHAQFGLCARFRDDLADESMSPLKPSSQAAVAIGSTDFVTTPAVRTTQRHDAAMRVKAAVRKAAAGGITPPSASKPCVPTVSLAAAGRAPASAAVGVKAAGTSYKHTQSIPESPTQQFLVPSEEFWQQLPSDAGTVRFDTKIVTGVGSVPGQTDNAEGVVIHIESGVPQQGEVEDEILRRQLQNQPSVCPRDYTEAERSKKRARKPPPVGSDSEPCTSEDSDMYEDTLEPVNPNRHKQHVQLMGYECFCIDCRPDMKGKKRKATRRKEQGKRQGDSDGKAMRWTAKDRAVAKEAAKQQGSDMKAMGDVLVAGDERIATLDRASRMDAVASLNEGNLKVAKEQNKGKFAELFMSAVDKFVAQGMSEDDAIEKAKARIAAMQAL